jgi:hypothetical protein
MLGSSARLVLRAVAALALAVACGAAAAFDVSVREPAFTLSVPDLPDFRLEPAAAGTGPLLAGRDGALQATVAVTRAPADGSTRVCAGTFLRTLVTRKGMPERDSIYRAPLNETTFVVLYLLGDEPERSVHAHVLAAVAGDHCAEAHFWRPLAEGEDLDAWRQRFMRATMR